MAEELQNVHGFFPSCSTASFAESRESFKVRESAVDSRVQVKTVAIAIHAISQAVKGRQLGVGQLWPKKLPPTTSSVIVASIEHMQVLLRLRMHLASADVFCQWKNLSMDNPSVSADLSHTSSRPFTYLVDQFPPFLFIFPKTRVDQFRSVWA